MSEIIKTESTVDNSASIFKPEHIEVELGGEKYPIIYDMNSFIELEKIYGNIDTVIKKVLGNSKKEHVVKDGDAIIDAKDITVDDKPLDKLLSEIDAASSDSTITDTLNILYCGLMHDLAIYNEHDEIVGYKVSKQKIGSMINFKNIKDINVKLVIAFVQDLIPSKGESKNETGAKEKAQGLHYSAE